MKVYRTSGRTSKYIVARASDNHVISDAVVFFPNEDEAALKALAYVVSHMDKDGDAEADYAALRQWLLDLSEQWAHMQKMKPWED